MYDARTKKDQGGLKNVGGQENNSRDFFNRPEIYCEKHRKERQKEYELYQRKYNHRERYDGRWDKVRNIYIKNHPLCEECLKENITKIGELVHHKIPIEDGGEKYDFDNLETVCRSCHSKLHIKLKKRKNLVNAEARETVRAATVRDNGTSRYLLYDGSYFQMEPTK